MTMPAIPDFLDRRSQKPLVYSFTLLNTYRNVCKHQAYRRFIKKDIPFKSTPAMEWGDKVHKALELRIQGGKPLPPDMRDWEKFALPLVAAKAAAEAKLGMTAEGKPCDFFGNGVWFRGKLDTSIVNLQNNTAILFDWKTSSKPREDPFELECQALLLNAKYPQITKITGSYVWLKENRIGQQHDVSYTNDTFTYVKRIAADMAEDTANGVWEKQKGGLCPWCPCNDCEHFTGGNGR